MPKGRLESGIDSVEYNLGDYVVMLLMAIVALITVIITD